jgi:hypothetical protein
MLTSECHKKVGVKNARWSWELSPVKTTWTSSSPGLRGTDVVACYIEREYLVEGRMTVEYMTNLVQFSKVFTQLTLGVDIEILLASEEHHASCGNQSS